MATISDIVTGALRRIGVTAHDEQPDAASADIGLAAFNGLMTEAALAGWLASHTTATLASTLVLDDAYIEGLKAAVGVRIAPEFGREASMSIRVDAQMFMSQLANAAWSGKNIGIERGVWDNRPGDYY